MLRTRCDAVIGAALLLSFASRSGAADLPADASVDVAAPSPSPPGAAPLDAAEQQRLLDELNADGAGAPLADLTKVNLAAGIPGVQSLNPDMAIILDVAGAWFAAAEPSKAGSPLSDSPIMTGGHDPVENGFTLRQVELAFSASVDPYLRFDANLVIKDELEVEEAYATALTLPFNLQARAGEFLSRFGRHNEQHPHAWWFISQPLVYGHIMGEDNFRGLGVEASWLSPLPWPVTVILEAQGTSGACCSRTFSPKDSTPVQTPGDLVVTSIVEQFFEVTDDLSVLWGVSAMTGSTPYIDVGARGEVFGTDLLVRYKPPAAESRWFIELQTEGLLRARHPGGWFSPNDLVQDALVDGGAYAQLVYHPNPEYGVGARYDFVNALPNDVAAAALGPNTHRGAIVAEFAPTHFSRIQAEVNGGTRGQGDLLWGAMVNLEVAVGAHGAHAF